MDEYSKYLGNNIICPKCGGNCDFNNTEKELFKCLNGHHITLEMNKLREKIDMFKSNLNKIINIFNGIIDYIEKYYEIINNNLNKYKSNIKNDKKIQNINEFKYKIILKYINQIINNKNINNQFYQILKIYNKFNSVITLRYKINNMKRIKIFDLKFVKKNYENCNIIVRQEGSTSKTYTMSCRQQVH